MATSNYSYFTQADFQKAVPGCSISDMDDWFLKRLDTARHLAGVPFIINSAFRSVDWEKKHGRKGTSAHTYGMAVDIKCLESEKRFKIINALLRVGFSRIGIAKTYIHVDDSLTHPDNLIWLYE